MNFVKLFARKFIAVCVAVLIGGMVLSGAVLVFASFFFDGWSGWWRNAVAFLSGAILLTAALTAVDFAFRKTSLF